MINTVARKRLVLSSLLCGMLLIILAGCGWFGNSTVTPTPTPTVANAGVHAGQLSPVIDTNTAQVLENIHLHGWNPNSMVHGVVTGGLYINWVMDDPSVTNQVTPGPDGNAQHNHDPQVELWYLTSLADYHALHPNDHQFDDDLAHMTAFTLAEFQNYNQSKGWIYFNLLRIGSLLPSQVFTDAAHTMAANLYAHWYDPNFGIVYNVKHTPGDYAVDHTISAGAALIDAGTRWNQPAWVKAGESTIDQVVALAYNTHYHLFYTSMIVGQNGHETIENPQAKPSTEGEAVDALVTAYNATHLKRYLQAATQTLQALFKSSLVDNSRGGLYFALDMSNGQLSKKYKETRSQALVLAALQHYNQANPGLFTSQEQQLISVITTHFYQHTYYGYFYRVTPDFQIYQGSSGQGFGLEKFFTTEAMGCTTDALQQTEMTM